ncbi:MAG: hypothetical protein CVU61_09945 [Deltaproteobacteria bacterium HGW-Deltaproteobacteria-19]|jgi:hypothetical protein|nr:MAG: hypothetical protein CVU61_09945 [Deltaproteobacteria bacterium HGW-Deltaproteobacteria-19]
MESLWATDVVIPLSSLITVLLLSTLGLIMGRLKLTLFLMYGYLMYWGRLWDVSIFTDSASRLSGPALLITGLFLLLVLFAMLGLVFHRE